MNKSIISISNLRTVFKRGYFSLIFILLGFANPSEKENKWCYAELVIPPKYQKVNEVVMTIPGRTIMLPSICQENLTDKRLNKIKRALQNKGYQIKNVEGSLEDEILKVLTTYQKENGLHEGSFTKETMDRLGINFKQLYRKNGTVFCEEMNSFAIEYDKKTEEVIAGGETHIVTRKVFKRQLMPRIETSLCEDLLTKKTIKKIQKRLRKKGYEVDKINGLKDSLFLDEFTKFQKDNLLPYGSFNLKTMDALNIRY